MASLAQVTGFIVGPLLQAGFTAIGDGFVLPGGLRISMYTAPGWANVILGIANICLFLPRVFEDHNIAVREQMMLQGKESTKDTYSKVKIDYVVTCALIFSYFIVAFNLVILESLGTPLTMDQFAFSREETLRWTNVLVGIGAFVSCVIFCLLPRVSKMFKEINVLIWGGLLVAVIGKIIYIPYRDIDLKIADNVNNSDFIIHADNSTELLGKFQCLYFRFYSNKNSPIRRMPRQHAAMVCNLQRSRHSRIRNRILSRCHWVSGSAITQFPHSF
jgi:ceroid-lipofuscinosis MFS transporter 7